MSNSTPLKIKKITAGVYTTEDGRFQIVKDGYEPIRDWNPDKRFHNEHQGNDLYVGPEEVCWIVIKMETDQNLVITDTLRDAKRYLANHLAK